MTREEMASYIDLTNVYAHATEKDIKNLCKSVKKNNLRGPCVSLDRLDICVKMLKNTNFKKSAVIDFPFGASGLKVKKFAAMQAKIIGADEVDPLINIGRTMDAQGNKKFYKVVQDEIRAIQDADINGKFIIESGYWNDDQIIDITQVVGDAGAFCIKTSTTCSPVANVNKTEIKCGHIEIMKNTIEKYGYNMITKISGGIREYWQAILAINSGADIIGASDGMGIINGCPQ